MTRRNVIACWLVLGAWVGAGECLAQGPTEAPPAVVEATTAGNADAVDPELLTLEESQQWQEEIRQKLGALDASGLGEEDRKKAAEAYQRALNSLATLEEYRAAKEKHERESRQYLGDENYEGDLHKYQRLLAELPAEPRPISAEDQENLQQALVVQEQAVAKAQAELAKAEEMLKIRQTRLIEIPQQIVERQKELENVNAELQKAAVRDGANVLADAEQEALAARAEALKMQLAEMVAQRRYFAQSPDLAQVRRDYRTKSLAQEEKKLAAIRQTLDARRLAQAEEQAIEASRTAAVERPTAIAELAKRNQLLAEEQTKVASKIPELTEELAAIDREQEKLKKAFSGSRDRVATAGSTEVGQELRRQQEQLPDISAISRRIALRTQERDNASYRSLELQELRDEAADAEMQDRVAAVLEAIPADQRAGAEAEIRKLLDDELKILNSSIDTYDTYSRNLTDLLASEEELRIDARAYADFIAEHVLWIRSTNVPRWDDVEAGAAALAWTIDPANWQAVARALWNKTGQWPLAVVLFAVVMGFSLYLHRRMRTRLRAIGETAAKRTSTDFWLSVEALWITVLLALPWPLLLWFCGWWMHSPLNESEFVRALSISLQFAAYCLLLLEVVRHLCRSGGLADAHFNWPQACLAQVRRHVRWLAWICLPLVIWLTTLEVQNVEKLWSSSLGRACFVMVMVLLTVASYRVLLAGDSPFRQLLTKKADSMAIRLFHIWSPAVTVLPILLAIVSVIGYHYTAEQLAVRLLQMAGLVLVLSIAGGLAKRWILVNRRRLAREQAKQKRAQVVAVTATGATSVSDEAAVVAPADLIEDSVDLVALGEQTSKLLFTILIAMGLVSAWFVWQDMLPALSRFTKLPILPLRPDIENPLTWGGLVQFLLVVGVTYIAVRNLPALMEFAILQRLPLDPGSRYAITSISRYILVAIGISMAYQALGFDPTSIQWLIAAMGVGLGFGLQEIFANFVSGIILLFERPIRVGDVVTLGDKTGAVSRIRMRATTIIDGDRKEYIVPNKDLITERLLNWTLSDGVNRIEIRVSVPFGSDTDLVCRLLKEAATEHPLVLNDPEPSGTLEGFGPSTLNFALRCFLPTMDKRLMTIHELNTAINQKFMAEGLALACPQSNLVVKSWPREWTERGAHAEANGTSGAQEKSEHRQEEE